MNRIKYATILVMVLLLLGQCKKDEIDQREQAFVQSQANFDKLDHKCAEQAVDSGCLLASSGKIGL